MRHYHVTTCCAVDKFVVRSTNRYLFKAIAQESTNDITAVAQQRIPRYRLLAAIKEAELSQFANSHPLHKAIHHLLLPRPVERDGELVALDLHHVAIAEFLVEHAVADRVGRDGAGRFRNQFAFDGQRAGPRAAAACPCGACPSVAKATR